MTKFMINNGQTQEKLTTICLTINPLSTKIVRRTSTLCRSINGPNKKKLAKIQPTFDCLRWFFCQARKFLHSRYSVICRSVLTLSFAVWLHKNTFSLFDINETVTCFLEHPVCLSVSVTWIKTFPLTMKYIDLPGWPGFNKNSISVIKNIWRRIVTLFACTPYLPSDLCSNTLK